MRLLLDDVRYAWRQLRRTPGFTVVAVLTLALGIATTTAFFGVLKTMLFRGGGVKIENVVQFLSTYPDERSASFGMQRSDFRALEQSRPNDILAIAAVDTAWGCAVQVPGRAEYATCEQVTLGYAGTFGVQVAVGRWFDRSDERPMGGETVVISDRLWRLWFGGDARAVGRDSIKVSHGWRRIVGVMPSGFRGLSESVDVWELQPTLASAIRPPSWWKKKRPPSVSVYARMAPETPVEAIIAHVTQAVQAGSPNPEAARTTFSVSRLREREASSTILWLLVFAGLVFLAACANLANMLYARGTQRMGEIAVRLSLGASRARIVRLFLAEAATISTIAAAAGLTMAVGVSRWFADVFPILKLTLYSRTGIQTAFDVDRSVFLVAFGLGLAAAVSVGLASAWRSTRGMSLRPVAASGTAGSVAVPARGLQTSLVSIQITAAVLLVLAASLFIENTRKAYDERVTYDTSRLAAARVELPGYELDPAGQPVRTYTESRGLHFFDRLRRGAADLPAVEAVALVDLLPGATDPRPKVQMGCFTAELPDGVQRGPVIRADAARVIISSGALGTLGIPILSGRDVFATDTADTPPVAIVTESVAKALWPDMNPVGSRMHDCVSRKWVTVVGVSADVLKSRNRPVNHVFLPFTQHYQSSMLLVARSEQPAAQADAMRTLVGSLDPEVAVFEAAPVGELLLRGVAMQRASRMLALSLGGLSLGIAVLGVYGVVAYFVSRRTREFGLRLALGATRRQVLKLVVDHAVHIVLVGLVPAVLLASLGARYLGNTARWFLPNDIPTWFQVP
ncbi:MAG TPA: FtsX-like permease family protein, partial [Vicinamibacterales bacterium]|nr:FtsX-like permease family protein [Vicinamibacterales bacterium]